MADSRNSQERTERTLILIPNNPPWQPEHERAVAKAADEAPYSMECNEFMGLVDIHRDKDFFVFAKAIRRLNMFKPLLINLELSLLGEGGFNVPVPRTTPGQKALVRVLERIVTEENS
eukprot:TRINITY_DN25279_c0_g1_i1.p1 TRINITY_DN25279_c0_g1~~TRINITY_DN25279_c0_g1_i1.p1  ORF type:complete len:132 (+),score=20.33 TRINITY_DN25279_c0_g1_i1:43-396(+)